MKLICCEADKIECFICCGTIEDSRETIFIIKGERVCRECYDNYQENQDRINGVTGGQYVDGGRIPLMLNSNGRWEVKNGGNRT